MPSDPDFLNILDGQLVESAGADTPIQALFHHMDRPPFACLCFSYPTPVLFPPLAHVNDAAILTAMQTPTLGGGRGVWTNLNLVHTPKLPAATASSISVESHGAKKRFTFVSGSSLAFPHRGAAKVHEIQVPTYREVTRVCFLIRVIKLVTRMQYLLGDPAVDCGVSTLSKSGLIKSNIGGPDVKEAQRGRVHYRNPVWYTWSQSLGAFRNGP